MDPNRADLEFVSARAKLAAPGMPATALEARAHDRFNRADVSGVWWIRFVASIALAGAVVVSLFEAYLLERKFGFFRGGYLAGYHLEGVGDIGWFLLASLISDFLIIAFVTGTVLYVAAHTRL